MTSFLLMGSMMWVVLELVMCLMMHGYSLSRVFRQRGPVVGRLSIVSKLQNPTCHGEVDMTLFIKRIKFHLITCTRKFKGKGRVLILLRPLALQWQPHQKLMKRAVVYSIFGLT